jgi:N-methylhydantoinase A
MQDSSPMILFVGQVRTDMKGREAFQEIDYRAVFGALAKWVVEIDDVARIPEIVARAWTTSLTGRPGPVVVALPENVLTTTTDLASLSGPAPIFEAAPDAEAIVSVRDILAAARRPVMLIGGSNWTGQGRAALQAFAEASDIPVIAAFRYQDQFDNGSPVFVGEAGVGMVPHVKSLIREADVLLAVNVRFGEMTTDGYTLLSAPVPTQKLIHVHASDREIGKIYVPTIGICSGPNAFAKAVAPVKGAWAEWRAKARESIAVPSSWHAGRRAADRASPQQRHIRDDPCAPGTQLPHARFWHHNHEPGFRGARACLRVPWRAGRVHAGVRPCIRASPPIAYRSSPRHRCLSRGADPSTDSFTDARCRARFAEGHGMTPRTDDIRLGADIGGTFTDIALDVRGKIFSTKVLTNYGAPEQAILDGIAAVTRDAGISAGDIGIIIHGTTLATNALIERRGAKTALVTTEGFRDVVEMRTENRFEQYDLNLRLPSPLIPREHRFTVKGRIGAEGQELQPLDEAGLKEIADTIAANGFGAVAIGFIHSYTNPSHEERAREILSRRIDVPISISAEVSPQMREFERFNTVCANAYVRPQMANYLARLQSRLKELGARCPVFMIHSGGGLISVETASAFPVRLVESGPAGGAIFAADVASRFGLQKVVSYDMGGTTAKICLIEDFAPRTARTFEVARTYRFCKGSGMPISIPVIEMIEIGAGGGSIAWVDAMGRIQTGPESAGSEPGPACYGRGGKKPAITDADLILGKLDPDNFAGGAIKLHAEASQEAIQHHVGQRLSLDTTATAFGICEVVDENMANAARVHAVENGKNISDNVMIAFGGAAPLHTARLCEKLDIDQCLVPQGAGVGSAIGFLKAPFSYEAVASKLTRLSDFEPGLVNALLEGLKASAERFVRVGTSRKILSEITAFMRYAGQGWEIPVALPDKAFDEHAVCQLKELFRENYQRFFGRAIDGLEGLEIEIVTWSVKATDERAAASRHELTRGSRSVQPKVTRAVFDPAAGSVQTYGIIERDTLLAGDRVSGPAVIVERETSTVVTTTFDAVIQSDGAILLIRKGS